jgi:nicotinamide mononucleotide transporter
MADWFAGISALEAAGVAFAIAYLVLAIRQSQWCWGAALVSVLLSLVLFANAKLYMESALQIFYAAMAVYGWYQWRLGGPDQHGVAIETWSARRHAAVVGATLIVSAAFGFALGATDAALPYLDSFTTVAAMVTTYMVAKKVLENWIYWFVIDALSIYLYASRGLPLYAALFAFYLVLIVIGYRRWHKDYRAQMPGWREA